ncbi:hypothetical protein T02_2508 [Trichinella nativa]|uniref:Uncharacterized protein n=1 Tax=Trichinella nativa TaxID=6335 RepID=A0A0V1LNF3_9BILA|nr:hypothetical protein T02_2508 [Trichinella nativa]
MNNEEKEKRKHGKQITDDTKQNKERQKVYVVLRGSQFCRSGLGILRKGEVPYHQLGRTRSSDYMASGSSVI